MSEDLGARDLKSFVAVEVKLPLSSLYLVAVCLEPPLSSDYIVVVCLNRHNLMAVKFKPPLH